jgi:hypothetical protein
MTVSSRTWPSAASAHYHLLLPRELVVDDEPRVARMAPLPGQEGLDRRGPPALPAACRRPPMDAEVVGDDEVGGVPPVPGAGTTRDR